MRPNSDRPLHENVRDLVSRSDLTEGQIAQQAQWSEKRLRRLLQGRTRLLAEDIVRLSRILRTPATVLLYGDSAVYSSRAASDRRSSKRRAPARTARAAS